MSSDLTPGCRPDPAPTVDFDASTATRPCAVRPVAVPAEVVGSTQPAQSAPPLSTAPPALPGYEILGELGRGGMGVVYKARHIALDRLVAIKMIQAGTRAGAEERARFQNEAAAVARLQHPNIVQVYELGEHQGCPWFALEFVDGPDLASVLAGRPLPAAVAAELVAILAGAVHHAHQRGIVHRDLKPANILLSPKSKVQSQKSNADFGLWTLDFGLFDPKITDFGLARHLNREAGLTQSGQVLGTPSYMAPEQALGDRRRIGPRSDVYALGAILYELLTGRPPFQGETVWDTLARVAYGEAVPPRRLRPDVPVPLETISLKALSREPEQRYASAADLADDLHRFLHGTTVRARPESWLRRQGRRLRRHPVRLATALLVLVLAITAAGVVWSEERRLVRDAAAALDDGRARLEERHYAEAVRTLTRGLESARQARSGRDLAVALEDRLAQARRGLAAGELHELAERARFLFDPDSLPPASRRTLEGHCRTVWQARGRLLDTHGLPLDADTEQTIQTDLLDLVLLCTDLQLRSATDDEQRRHVLDILAEAETQFGRSPVLARQRQTCAAVLGRDDLAANQGEPLPPCSAWECYTLGRLLLRSGRADEAAAALERAVAAQPRGFWPHFYRGICAYQRGHADDAVEALSLCIFQAPKAAACYHNRALAHAALGRTDKALQDYDRALQLDPSLAAAALNRGLLHGERGDYDRAVADFEHALRHGADPAAAWYNLAVVHDRRRDRAAALTCVEHALRHEPAHAAARDLRQRLKANP